MKSKFNLFEKIGILTSILMHSNTALLPRVIGYCISVFEVVFTVRFASRNIQQECEKLLTKYVISDIIKELKDRGLWTDIVDSALSDSKSLGYKASRVPVTIKKVKDLLDLYDKYGNGLIVLESGENFEAICSVQEQTIILKHSDTDDSTTSLDDLVECLRPYKNLPIQIHDSEGIIHNKDIKAMVYITRLYEIEVGSTENGENTI